MTTITVAEIAKSLKTDPKVARARLRSAKVKKPKEGWTFPAARKAEISKVIKGE